MLKRIKSLFPAEFKESIRKKLMFSKCILRKDIISPLGELELDDYQVYCFLKDKYQYVLDEITYELDDSHATPKIVWWCWLQGEENAPQICKVCLSSIRKYLPNYQINVISYQNVFDYITLPEYILEKYKMGFIDNTKFSNLVRTLLLIEYGGVWIDSTILFTGYKDPIFNNSFFVFQDWKYDISQARVASNWLICSCKNHPILKAVRDLHYAYWKDFDKSIHYHFYFFFLHMVADKYQSLWKRIPRYSDIPPHILQYEMFEKYDESRFLQIKNISDIHKLSWKQDFLTKNTVGTFYEYICNQLSC